MENKGIIRIALKSDTPEIVVLAGQLGYSCKIDVIEKKIDEYKEEKRKAIFVYEQDKKVVSWMSLEIVDHFYSEPFAEITGFVVDEQLGSKGIGNEMITKAKEWAEEKGERKLRVRCNSKRERAHSFYLKTGFKFTKQSHVFEMRLNEDFEKVQQTVGQFYWS